MASMSRRHSNHKPRHLTLGKFEQSKTSVLNALGSMQSRRSYQHVAAAVHDRGPHGGSSFEGFVPCAG